MYELDYRVPKVFDRVTDNISSLLFKDYREKGYQLNKSRRLLLRQAVQCFLLNAKNGNGKAMAITLDRKHYSKGYILNGKDTGRKVSHRYTRDLVDYLDQNDYIDMVLGKRELEYNAKTDSIIHVDSLPTIIVFKPLMVDLLKSIVLKRTPLKNVVVLRDKQAMPMTFRADTVTRGAMRFLNAFNNFSIDKMVQCKGREYNVQMYKVMNMKLTIGGRTYMKDSIQNLSGEDRSHLMIEGKETARYDYKGFEPSILYSLKGVKLDDDPYDISGGNLSKYDCRILRDITKQCLLVMLNAESKSQTAYCINSYIKENYNVKDLYERGLIPSKSIPVGEILLTLELKHKTISDSFYRGTWGELQYIGARIVDGVVETMMQQYDTLVLQVFDECIVDKDFEEELIQAMFDSYANITGFPQNCKIVKEN